MFWRFAVVSAINYVFIRRNFVCIKTGYLMFAIISDIHSNLEALTTVLADIEKRGIKTVYCLGDVIGYGPDPKPCLDLVIEKTKWCVLGNHDYAVFYEPTNFNYAAEQASFWTRDVLETEQDKGPREKRWDFLGHLPMRQSFNTKLADEDVTIDFLHASPRKPINEYIFPDDVYTNPAKIKSLFDRIKHVCFVGHTHLPGVFLDSGRRKGHYQYRFGRSAQRQGQQGKLCLHRGQ
jgi:predicted phosphodiesterase